MVSPGISKLLPFLVLIVLAALAWLRYTASVPRAEALPVGSSVGIEAPFGLPPVPIPQDNAPTRDTIALGRRLFFDPALSVNETVACATCHDPDFGFSDGKPVSEGVGRQRGERNAPSILNAAYLTTQFWDGRAPNLEKQAEAPVLNPIEMAHTLEAVEERLAADPAYRIEFAQAFGPGAITYRKVAKAIASFERTVLSGNSPFDRYFYGGDESALSQAAKRGLEIFRNPEKGNCTACHPLGLFTDNSFHNIGVGVGNNGELADLGRYQVSNKDVDRGAFKTPSLRDVARTAPYMHDGSLNTLQEVVDFYVGGGNSNAHLDPLIKPLTPISPSGELNWSRSDLVAFLKALTGENPDKVRSLPPGTR